MLKWYSRYLLRKELYQHMMKLEAKEYIIETHRHIDRRLLAEEEKEIEIETTWIRRINRILDRYK